MFVLNELKKSIKEFEGIIKQINKVDTIGEFDALELKSQKIVFELQMKANQVAGEFVPKLREKRTSLQSVTADQVVERLAALRQKALEKADISDTPDDEPDSEPNEPDSEPNEPDSEPNEPEGDKEGKEDGDNNRQSGSKSGDGKPESSKKTK